MSELVPSSEEFGTPGLRQGSPMPPSPLEKDFASSQEFLTALGEWEQECNVIRDRDRWEWAKATKPAIVDPDYDKRVKLTLLLSGEVNYELTLHLLPETTGLLDVVVQLRQYVQSLCHEVELGVQQGASQFALASEAWIQRADGPPAEPLSLPMLSGEPPAQMGMAALPAEVQEILSGLLEQAKKDAEPGTS